MIWVFCMPGILSLVWLVRGLGRRTGREEADWGAYAANKGQLFHSRGFDDPLEMSCPSSIDLANISI